MKSIAIPIIHLVQQRPVPGMSHVAVAFIALVAQNASINVLARITRLGASEDLYAPSTIVIMCEGFKAVISLCFATAERKAQLSATTATEKQGRDVSTLQCAREIGRDVLVVRRRELLQAAIPSLLYAASNNLS